jgi:Secretion system C-terminal sorting domain/CotH kinase protein
MGPVWDYDLAYRNANYCSGSDTWGWAFKFNEICPNDGAGLIPFWWNKLMTDTAFEGSLRCRWKALRQSTLSLDRLNFIIDSIAGIVDEAQQRHFTRWPVLGKYVWPNPDPIPVSYAGELSSLKEWLRSRVEWIDVSIPNIGICADYYDVPGAMKVNIYPNPVGNSGLMKIKSPSEQQVNLIVVDMEGRILTKSSQLVFKGENTIDLHTERWPKGVYFIEVTNQKKEEFRQKLIKL